MTGDRRGLPLSLARRDLRQGPRRRGGWSRWPVWSPPAWPGPASDGCWVTSQPGQRRGIRLAVLHPCARRARSVGVGLVISDDHAGLVRAVREQLLGSGWQRCRVHFTRNAQDLVPRSARSMVASAIRAVFEQPDEASARDQCGRVIAAFGRAFRRSPPARPGRGGPARPFHVPRDASPPDPLDQPAGAAHKEIKRRTAVVGIFPNRGSVIRLVGMILAEQDDEWQDGRRYFRPETMALIDAVAPMATIRGPGRDRNGRSTGPGRRLVTRLPSRPERACPGHWQTAGFATLFVSVFPDPLSTMATWVRL